MQKEDHMKVLIVGGVAGGATAAARLRRLDEDAEIIMFEKGEYISYANCGLPYYIGGEIKEKEKLTLQTPESFHSRYDVDVRIVNEVVSIHPEQKSVEVLNLKTGESYTESYDKLILSPGAMPIVPDFPGSTGERIFTLRNIPDTYRIKEFIRQNNPKQAVVVGGGYIGVEMAENLHQAGLHVTIVELMDHVIGPIDFDMACEVHRHIESKGVRLILKDGVKSIKLQGDVLDVVLGNEVIHTDMLIMAVGVKPDTRLAKDANLAVNARGSIIVDEHMLTSHNDIYAVGDAVEVTDFVTKAKGFIPLAGPANKQARIAADHITGIDSSYKGTQGSSILKCFDLAVACTGINEKAAQRAGIDYEKSYTYSMSHASYYPGGVNMSVKLLFEKKSGKVLGAQIIGSDGVDKRCDVIATAIRAGMTVYDLTELELSYAPPYSSAKDPVNMAGYVAENILTEKTRIFHWHDVAGIDFGKSILLDIRTTGEYSKGFIPGSIHIPLDSLRSRIHELDQTKTIHVVCQVGLRGHVACRILSQRGYQCLNLSGGYRLYNSIFGKSATPGNLSMKKETTTAKGTCCS
jgi:NADPH-dependent 2,4-dienoyl-CoA reductase/sulfur reductase-like enzyme/rhodanese-related sulfurtransferase